MRIWSSAAPACQFSSASQSNTRIYQNLNEKLNTGEKQRLGNSEEAQGRLTVIPRYKTVFQRWCLNSRTVVSLRMHLTLALIAFASIVGLSAGALSVVQQFLTRSDYNLKWKYGTAQSVKWITIHNTANKASAQNEATYLNNRQDNQYISFHYVVDDKQALHLLPDNMYVFHQ